MPVRVAPNIITFNASVTALTAGQQWESAVSLLGDMQEVRLQPDLRGNDRGGIGIGGDASTPNRPLIADRSPIAPTCPGRCGFTARGLSPIYRRCIADFRSMHPPLRKPPPL
eukprot:376119-Pyramimonas_sp.AAC.1